MLYKIAAEQAGQQVPQEQQQQLAQQGQATEAPQNAVMTPMEMETDEFMPVGTFAVYRRHHV